MEYQKIANLLDNRASNQASKFRTKNWVETSDESRGGYTTGSDINFKTTMLRFMHIYLLRSNNNYWSRR